MGQLQPPRPRAGKWKAVVTEITRMHKAGRPVLVGTTSVERSEGLAVLLGGAGARGPTPWRHCVCMHGAAGQPWSGGAARAAAAAAARRPVRSAGQPGRSSLVGLFMFVLKCTIKILPSTTFQYRLTGPFWTLSDAVPGCSRAAFCAAWATQAPGTLGGCAAGARLAPASQRHGAPARAPGTRPRR
jgi:hypothetical protein